MQDSNYQYGGSLFEELSEVGKMIPNEEKIEATGTYTEKCAVVLTILCC